MSEQWWESQPRAARTNEALRKVFAMARCIPGSQDREEREDWEAWLDEMERIWCGVGLPSCDSKEITPYPLPCTPRPYVRQRRCSACGQEGHRKTTCSLDLKNIETESK